MATVEKLVEKLKQQHNLVGSMKKSLFITLLCGVALVSCETNNMDNIQENTEDYGKRTFTILSDNSDTRAVFNGTNGSLWKATDKIGVACTYGRYGYVTDETIQPFSISNAGDAEMIEIGEFTGALTDKGSKTYVYYAYTPYSDGVSCVVLKKCYRIWYKNNQSFLNDNTARRVVIFRSVSYNLFLALAMHLIGRKHTARQVRSQFIIYRHTLSYYPLLHT